MRSPLALLNLASPWCTRAAAGLLPLLAACGGGGGGDTAAPPSQSVRLPTSGSYAWVLRAQGPTDALKYGLSLVHPSIASAEFVVEPGSAVITDTKLVLSGTVDASRLVAEGLAPYALLYILGGDVRAVPLEADGSEPLSRVRRAQSTSACSFVIDAQDPAQALNSRFVVATAGADGQCQTGADNGRAEVKFTSTGALTYTPIAGAAPLGVFRDATTLAPRGWINPTQLTFWEPAGASPVTLRAAGQTPLLRLIAQSHRDALLDDGTQLSVLDLSNANAPIETRLGAALTGGGGWASIGFDASHYYVYRNSGATLGATWTVLQVSRAAPAANVLASGTGQLAVASLGSTQLYVTLLGNAENRLLALPKAPGAAIKTIDTGATSTLSTVLTSANNVHQWQRIQNIGSASVSQTVKMIDETEATLFGTGAGGFTLAPADAQTLNYNASESRTRFVFVTGYGDRAFSGASLVAYDSVTKAATTLGTLPGSAEYGNDFVFAALGGSTGSFMTGFAARSSGGVVQDSGSKVFSFELAQPGSVRFATIKQ
jgi:hypothetical protein